MNNNGQLWQQYITSYLGSKVAQAMIINKQDATPWATSEGFGLKSYKDTVQYDDGSEVEELIDEEVGLIEVAKNLQKPKFGFRFGEKKYYATRTLPNGQLEDNLPTLYLKKNQGGATLCVTERAIIIGTWEEGKQTPAGCNDIVESLARHLKSHKY